MLWIIYVFRICTITFRLGRKVDFVTYNHRPDLINNSIIIGMHYGMSVYIDTSCMYIHLVLMCVYIKNTNFSRELIRLTFSDAVEITANIKFRLTD